MSSASLYTIHTRNHPSCRLRPRLPAASRRLILAVLRPDTFDEGPIFGILHESIYQSAAGQAPSNWAADRMLKDKYAAEFKVDLQTDGAPINFTGEHIYPWMFDDFAALRPLKGAAEILAQRGDWAPLYDVEKLRDCPVPLAAAVYYS